MATYLKPGNRRPRLDLLHQIKWKDNEGTMQKLHLFTVLSSKWDDVSDHLMIDQYTRKSIESKNPGDTKKCIREIIEMWLRDEKSLNSKFPCTWNGISSLLRDVQLSAVSEELEAALLADVSSFNNNLSEQVIPTSCIGDKKFIQSSSKKRISPYLPEQIAGHEARIVRKICGKREVSGRPNDEEEIHEAIVIPKKKQKKSEIWVRHDKDQAWYAAGGTRKVVIFVSKEAESPDVVHKMFGILTAEDKQRLTKEGIPYYTSDADIINAKYNKDKKIMKSVELIDQPMFKKDVLEKVLLLCKNLTEDGVTVHYIGPGRRHTGDWCFKDDFITFKDISNIYMEHFHFQGKTLVISSDCPYSGQWVEACKRFLQDNKVQPCGHSAMSKNIQIKVFCSCQPHEIGSTLLYSARANRTDVNTGAKYTRTDVNIGPPDQTTCFVDSTKIFCNQIPGAKCLLRPGFTYEEKSRRSRIVNKFQGNKNEWHVILLTDDLDNIKLFKEQADFVEIQNMHQFGRISKKTFTLEEAEEYIWKVKNGIEDIIDADFNVTA